MKLAKVMANDQNPCFSRRVGAVVVDPLTNGIVGAGYNGPPENTPHCNDIEFLKYFFWPQLTSLEKEKIYSYVQMGNTDSLSYADQDLNDSNKACQLLSTQDQCPRNILGY